MIIKLATVFASRISSESKNVDMGYPMKTGYDEDSVNSNEKIEQGILDDFHSGRAKKLQFTRDRLRGAQGKT